MTTAFNDVGMTVTGTPGTGTITLGSAINTTYLTAAEAGVPTGTVVSYVIFDGTDIEAGKGTYTSAGTTLSRDTVTFSKIGGTAGTTKLTLTSAAEVRFTQLAADHIPVAGSSTLSQFISVDSSGNLLIPGPVLVGGATIPSLSGQTSINQVSASGGAFNIHAHAFGNDGGSAAIVLSKTRSTTQGVASLINSGDNLGQIAFYGADNSGFLRGALILATSDGTPSTNDMPTRLAFFTTADGAADVSERMRIGNGGFIRMGSDPSSLVSLATITGSFSPFLQVNGTGSEAGIAALRYTAGNTGARLALAHSRSGTVGGHTVLNADDEIGAVLFSASDGDQFSTSAVVAAFLDAAGGDGDVPGRLLFYTTPDGSASPTERLRITKFGDVCTAMAGAIATNATDGFLYVPTCAGTPTGTPTGFTGQAPIVIDTTNNKLYFRSGGAWRDAGP